MKKLLFLPLVAAALVAPLTVSRLPETAAPKRESGRCCPVADQVVEHILAASVMVEVSGGSGSGVVFRNGPSTFIWTDAHVVAGEKSITTVVNPRTGQPVVRCTFNDVWVAQEQIEDGRKVGVEKRLARIVRYSDKHDLALLLAYRKGWRSNGVCFLHEREVPQPGEALWHVGSMHGRHGMSSLAEGVFAAAGRLRTTCFPMSETNHPVIYDQVSVNACLPGCSGGGFFRKSDGKCIGLVVEYLGPGHTSGAMCLAPARRIRQFANEAKCLYAVCPCQNAPENDPGPVMQDDLPLPKALGKE